jgi:PAS domain S-box-containing protein
MPPEERDGSGRHADLQDDAVRLRWLIENTSDAVWRFEMERPCRVDEPEDAQVEAMYRWGWLADANEAMARMYGHPSAGAMIGMRLHELLVRDDPRNELFLRAFVRSGYRVVDAESVDRGADGRPRYVLNSLVGEIRDGFGWRAWGTSRDITERKLAEIALRESEERSRLAIEAADVGIWDLDPASGETRLSPRGAEILGAGAGERDALARRAHPEHSQRLQRALERALERRGGGELNLEYLVGGEGAQDSSRWVALRGKALFDDRGRPSRCIGTVVDITARRAIQEALQDKTRLLERANDELERSNTELESFAYIASHDLQEPLRMVVNYLALLERRHPDLLQGKPGEYVREAIGGARRMQALIRGLLDYSRTGISHKPERVGADEALDAALVNLGEAIAAAGAVVRREPLPMVLADRVLLAQVFQNLLGNAIKFSTGGPEVAVRAEERDEEIVFAVADNGIGIDPAQLDGLFQVFHRLHGRDEYPGTGIGLATVKKIVERHGGGVWVESQPGRGSTFFFSLPKLEAATAARAARSG